MVIYSPAMRSPSTPLLKIVKHATQIRGFASSTGMIVQRQTVQVGNRRYSKDLFPRKSYIFSHGSSAQQSHQQARAYGLISTSEPRNLRIFEEVAWATHNNRPVVALESTIYTHGFPYPENLSLAFDLERIVRDHGAIPATIGILDGVACIGLSKEELTTLASSAGDPRTMKISRRDLPFILGKVGLYSVVISTIAYVSIGHN